MVASSLIVHGMEWDEMGSDSSGATPLTSGAPEGETVSDLAGEASKAAR